VQSVWVEAGVAVLLVQATAALAVLSAGRGERLLRRWLPYVVGVAVGVLLGTAVVHLMPEALEALGNRPAVWVVLLVSIAALFCFERIFHALAGVSAEPAPELDEQKCEDVHPGHHSHGTARPSTLLLGAVTHSLVDGTSVAAAFVVDRRLGWITALAVGLHEVPHRVGDFALLLHMELKRRRAAGLAIAAGLSSFVGWAVVSALGAEAPGRVAWLLPVSAGSFLYVSLVDLLPEVLGKREKRQVVLEVLAIAVGVALAIGLTRLPGA
jgi:zinc and cadmium transporter